MERTTSFEVPSNNGSSQGIQQPKNAVNRRPRLNYSMAGPNAYAEPVEQTVRFGSEQYGERPDAAWGMGKPFKNSKKNRNSKSIMTGKGIDPHREDNYRNGGGYPKPDVIPQHPEPSTRYSQDDEEAGHASGWNDENDQNRLVAPEDLDENGEEILIPNFWFGIRRKMREPLAEFLGTLVAVLLGICGNLAEKTSNGTAGSSAQASAAWGIGAMMAIYIAGGISGAHCNPSVSIFLSVFRGFPARKIPIYAAAQIAGAICAVSIAFGLYKDAIMDYDPALTSTPKGTGTAFFTLPRPFVNPATAFFSDFVSAAVMSGTAMALGDDSNAPPGSGMHAFIFGLIGFALASTLGYNTGHQTNVAKDIASRLVPFCVGYGNKMWENAWWAEAWVAAISGGLFGCLVYDLAIFEGEISPINWPSHKRKKSRKGTKGRWLATGLFGRAKKDKAKRELADGTIGVQEKGDEARLDGHGSV